MASYPEHPEWGTSKPSDFSSNPLTDLYDSRVPRKGNGGDGGPKVPGIVGLMFWPWLWAADIMKSLK